MELPCHSGQMRQLINSVSLIDFARFLALEQDRQEWLRFGQERLAQAYGQDEPDYSEADIRPNRNP